MHLQQAPWDHSRAHHGRRQSCNRRQQLSEVLIDLGGERIGPRSPRGRQATHSLQYLHLAEREKSIPQSAPARHLGRPHPLRHSSPCAPASRPSSLLENAHTRRTQLPREMARQALRFLFCCRTDHSIFNKWGATLVREGLFLSAVFFSQYLVQLSSLRRMHRLQIRLPPVRL